MPLQERGVLKQMWLSQELNKKDLYFFTFVSSCLELLSILFEGGKKNSSYSQQTLGPADAPLRSGQGEGLSASLTDHGGSWPSAFCFCLWQLSVKGGPLLLSCDQHVKWHCLSARAAGRRESKFSPPSAAARESGLPPPLLRIHMSVIKR